MLKGIDVSQHQGDVDWKRVKAAGYGFAICKASEGQDYQDPRWSKARVDAVRRAGLKLGVYHYLRPRAGRNGAVEARWAVPIAKAAGWGKPGDIQLVVDVEETALNFSRTVNYLVQFCNEVERLTGQKPVLYTFPAFAKQLNLPSAFSKYPLWLAHFDVSRPSVPSPWKRYTIWQYTSRGKVSGVSGNVDLNVADALPTLPEKKKRTNFKRLRYRSPLWAHCRGVTNRVIDIVNDEMGRKVGITSRKRWELFGNPSSDHYRGNVTADAVDFALVEAHELADKISRRLGGPQNIQDYEHFYITHNKRRFRIQIIAAQHGTGPHLHVGVKRA